MIGFMVDDLTQSQIVADLTRSVRASPHLDCCVFVRQTLPPWDPPPFPVFQWCDAFGAKFPLIATNLDSAAHLVRFPAVPRRYFYLADLEWLRHHRWGGPPPYHQLASIYRDPRLTLVCRSENHRKVVENCWNVTVGGVSPQMDINFFYGQ